MKQNKLSKQWFAELCERLDELFPKGKCKERGPALVLFAFAFKQIDTAIKAFGGCDKCYGKGYGTSMFGEQGYSDFGGEGYLIAPHNNMVFCKCPRGSQLEELLKPQTKTK